MEKWLNIVSELPLSKEERKGFDALPKKPSVTSILHLYSLLKDHEFDGEVTALLSYGLHKFPQHQTLRVLLAKELFARGLIEEVQQYLAEAAVTLQSNVLAQELLAKCALLREQEQKAYAHLLQLQRSQTLSPAMEELLSLLQTQGLAKTKEKLVSALQQQGIKQFFYQIQEEKGPHTGPRYLVALNNQEEKRKSNYHALPLSAILSPMMQEGIQTSNDLTRQEEISYKMEFFTFLLEKLRNLGQHGGHHAYKKTEKTSDTRSQWRQLRSFG
jgi:hypothetical protein